MNKKIKRFLDDEERMEKKIAEMQEQIKVIRTARQEEENREIIRDIRNLKLSGRELFDLLCGLEDGSVSLSKRADGVPGSGTLPFQGKVQGQAMDVAEREVRDDKKENSEMH